MKRQIEPALISSILKSGAATGNVSQYCDLVDFGPRLIPEYRTLLRDCRDARIVEALLAVLCFMGPAAAETVPEVATLTRNSNLEIRQAALRTLTRLGSEDAAVWNVIVLSAKDSDPKIRAIALDCLSHFEDAAVAVIDVVIDRLEHGTSDEKTGAMNALIAMGPAAKLAEKALAAPPSAFEFERAAKVLQSIREGDVLPKSQAGPSSR